MGSLRTLRQHPKIVLVSSLNFLGKEISFKEPVIQLKPSKAYDSLYFKWKQGGLDFTFGMMCWQNSIFVEFLVFEKRYSLNTWRRYAISLEPISRNEDFHLYATTACKHVPEFGIFGIKKTFLDFPERWPNDCMNIYPKIGERWNG